MISEQDKLRNKDVRVVRFYTNQPQPLDTQKEIPFILQIQNTGSTTVDPVMGTLFLGEKEQVISLGSLSPGQTKTITVQLTNNISDQLSKIGVEISDKDSSEAMKHYTWNGVMDVRMGSVLQDTSQELFWTNGKIRGMYKVYIANYGTKFVEGAEVMIQADGVSIGAATVNLEPRRLTTVTFPVEFENGGTVPLGFRVFHRNESNTNVLLTYGDNSVSTDTHSSDVELVAITPLKSNFESDESAEIEYEVRNNSGLGVHNLEIGFENATSGSTMGSTTITGVLYPGTTVSRKLSINNTSTAGGYIDLKIIADSNEMIKDSNTDNNSKVKRITWDKDATLSGAALIAQNMFFSNEFGIIFPLTFNDYGMSAITLMEEPINIEYKAGVNVDNSIPGLGSFNYTNGIFEGMSIGGNTIGLDQTISQIPILGDLLVAYLHNNNFGSLTFTTGRVDVDITNQFINLVALEIQDSKDLIPLKNTIVFTRLTCSKKMSFDDVLQTVKTGAITCVVVIAVALLAYIVAAGAAAYATAVALGEILTAIGLRFATI